MTGRTLKVRRITGNHLAAGGLLAGRVTDIKRKTGRLGEYLEYLGDFTYWPPAGDPLSAPALVLPYHLEGQDSPLPRAWTSGDFAGRIEAGAWAQLVHSPLAVDLPQSIALALLPAESLQATF